MLLLFFPLCGGINLVSPKLKPESSLVMDYSPPALLFLDNCLPMPPLVITSFLETLMIWNHLHFPFLLFYDQQPSASADEYSLPRLKKRGIVLFQSESPRQNSTKLLVLSPSYVINVVSQKSHSHNCFGVVLDNFWRAIFEVF